MLIGDLEATGLLEDSPKAKKADKIWIATFDAGTEGDEKLWIFINDDHFKDYEKFITNKYKPEVLQPLSNLKDHIQGHTLVGHNFIRYDVPLLKMILGYEHKGKVIDTLLLSKMHNPDRRRKGYKSGHSLAAWGDRFGVPKPEHEDWDNFSREMIHRNIEDVRITVKLYYWLKEKLGNARKVGINWNRAMKIEHDCSSIIGEAELAGVKFNMPAALQALKVLDREIKECEDFLYPRLPLKPGLQSTTKWKPEAYNKNMINLSLELGVPFEPIPDTSDKRFASFVSKIYTKGGQRYTANVASYWDIDNLPDNIEISGPHTRVKFEPISLSSTTQLRWYLANNGWIPDEFTDTGLPKITESSLKRFKHKDIGENLTRYMTLVTRRRTIENPDKDDKGWTRFIRPDGRITARNDTMGTPTARSRHSVVVNVPGVDSAYGSLLRDCFTTAKVKTPAWSFERTVRDDIGRALKEDGTVCGPKDKAAHKVIKVKNQLAMVGADASGLEMRMLAHEMNDPDLVEEILHGDIHTKIWKLIDDMVGSRGGTKVTEYALIYGAGDVKLGSGADIRGDFDKHVVKHLGWRQMRSGGWIKGNFEVQTFFDAQSAEIGAVIRKRIMEGLPALDEAITRNKEHAKKYGYLIGLDGRRLIARSPHSALNLKLQSGGALVMKKALINYYQQLQHINEYAKILIYYHDEFQSECHPDVRFKVGEAAVNAIIDAGLYFDLNCPLDAEYKIGLTWGDCH